MRKYFFI